METNLRLKYTPKAAHASALREFFLGARYGALGAIEAAAEAFGPEAEKKLTRILEHPEFDGYIVSGTPTTNAKSCDPGFFVGDGGFDFLMAVWISSGRTPAVCAPPTRTSTIPRLSGSTGATAASKIRRASEPNPIGSSRSVENRAQVWLLVDELDERFSGPKAEDDEQD